MTDALDRLVGPGIDLLDRVDAALMAYGFPADHPVAGSLRRLGALPGDVLRAISALRPAAVRVAGSELRRATERYQRQRDLLAAPVDWTGPAGERFSVHRAALASFIGDTGDAGELGLVGRLWSTVAYLDSVAEWMERSRSAMARVLADVLGSVEAIRLHTPDTAAAAATVGALVLSTAAEAHDAGRAVAERWAGRLDEVPYHPPTVDVPTTGDIRLLR
jgi:hypothetical protein